jgi:hypothetical protein
MKRLWKKYLDHITANFIKYTYMYGSLAVMLGFMAGANFWPHHTGFQRFLGFQAMFLSALYIHFLARAVCKLRDGGSARLTRQTDDATSRSGAGI